MSRPGRRRGRGAVGVAAALVVAAMAMPAAGAAAEPAECTTDREAWQITADCVDPLYATAVIDEETEETTPATHHRVSGHFEGTNIQFNIYLPPADQWEGRFFQYTYPVVFTPEQNTAVADDGALGFTLASGGYAVQAGNAGLSLGYRHTAAAAKFAEQYAAEYYGYDGDIHGYLYGPSGGSFQTVGAAENTTGVWDGFVPMVQGVPMSNPYTSTIRAAAELILGDKAEQVSDAALPGGSGDPYAGLDEGEAAMLDELLKFGVPLKGWEYPEYLLGWSDQFPNGLSGYGKDVDPGFVDDFWNTEGYLGTEDSPLGDAVRAALDEAGDTLENRWDIAGRFYYRHQVPPVEQGYAGFDQFRDADGAPLYPQRETIWGPTITRSVGGNTAFDGSINSKMIVVDNLYDTDALPYHADWYAQQVEKSLGDQPLDDSYRLYYNDHADHQGPPSVDSPIDPERAEHLVDWFGSVEQALRDLSVWVEDGVAPPASTRYAVEDGQVTVPDSATVRRGIQPTVNLRANLRAEKVTVRTESRVVLTAAAVAPRDAGKIVTFAWDCEGDGTYETDEVMRPGRLAAGTAFCRYDEPGTYFPAVKVTSARDGHEDDTFARVENLDRVRVVVTG